MWSPVEFPRAWLLSIARRAVIDGYRYAAARPRLSDVADWQPAVELAQPCDLPGFDHCIAPLDRWTGWPRCPTSAAALPDERRREAVILTQLVGLPYAEAAEVSDCPGDAGRPAGGRGHLPRPDLNGVGRAGGRRARRRSLSGRTRRTVGARTPKTDGPTPS